MIAQATRRNLSACRVFDYRWTKFPRAEACMREAHSVGSFVNAPQMTEAYEAAD